MTTRATYDLSDSIATITMDDGKVNALSLPMLAELNAAFDQAAKDQAIVILAGRPGVFSAGFDLPTLTGGGPDGPRLLRTGFELSERMLSFRMPIVIACSGHALAMGSFLLLSGDYRIGADGAFKIGANEVAIGMVMPATAIEICRQRLSPQYLSRAVNNAEIFSPAGALSAGWLDQCVAPEELPAAARDRALALAKLNLQAHAWTKLRLRDHALTAIHEAIEVDDAAFRATGV